MIKVAKGPLRPYHSFLSLEECQLDYCSSGCVFQNLPDSVQVVQQGPYRSGLAIIAGQQLWLNISAETHEPDHPLYLHKQKITIKERAALLHQIKQTPSEHLVKIHALCDCGLVIEIIKGLPLANLGTWPGWHRQMNRHLNQRDALAQLTWPKFLGVMADLAHGVDQLHQNGIVHGDLYPFNAIVTLENRGVWLDLNDVLPLTSVGMALDIWTFITYTLLTRLLRLKSWQPDVIKRVLELAATENLDCILKSIAHYLGQTLQHSGETQPLTEKAVAIVGQLCYQSGLQTRPDELGYVAQLLNQKGLLHTYNLYEQTAWGFLDYERQVATEKVRHRLVEQEIQRTLSLRYQTGSQAHLSQEQQPLPLTDQERQEIINQLSGEEISQRIPVRKLIKAIGFKTAAQPGFGWLYRFRSLRKKVVDWRA